MPNPSDPRGATRIRNGLWSAFRKSARRLSGWFEARSLAVKVALLTLVLLVPAGGVYALHRVRRHAALAEQAGRIVVGDKAGDQVWSLDDRLPIVLGSGSMLNFLASNPVDRINVIYRPLRGEASDRIVLVESQGKEHAFYPSDMETRIFTEKAVTAPWGAKLGFIPRSELSPRSLEWVERLDLRFAGARPRAAAHAWTTVASGPPVGDPPGRPADVHLPHLAGPVQAAPVRGALADARLHR